MFDNNIQIKTNAPFHDSNTIKPKVNPKEITPFDIADPTKITRPTKQEQQGNQGQNDLNYNTDSVFNKFLQALKHSPVLSESMYKLILNKQFINHNIKNDPILNSLFENFLENIEMDDKEILNFLKFQQNSYTKFQGDFFSTMENIFKSNPDNEDFKAILGNFLKSYDCFVSIDETYNSISNSLKNIDHFLPGRLKESFNELTSKIILNNSTNDNDMNLNLLKKDILPFIGRYISKMNDFGPLRDYVSVLIHNIVRLESGSKDNFSFKLDNLFDYIKYNLELSDKDLEIIKESLISSYEITKNFKNNSIDSFLKLIETGIKDSDNIVNKDVMENMIESLLFSKNVHIPLMHMFLPLNYKGMFMFSELWVNKYYEKSTNKKKPEYIQTHKAFITFDIQHIGYFETILTSKNDTLNFEIFVPSLLKDSMKEIKQDLNGILESSKISFSNISVSECVKKRRFNEIFNNLSERKNGVDVTI